MTDIKHQRVAVLATDGFEQAELTEPVKALKAEGAQVTIVSLKSGEIQGMKHHDKGDKTKVDLDLSQAKAEDFDALVLPGGVANPDTLRTDEKAVAFVNHLPWAVDADRGGCGGRQTSHLLAVAADRSAERRRRMGGPVRGR
jgi:protease I